jgi:hypothetical protein
VASENTGFSKSSFIMKGCKFPMKVNVDVLFDISGMIPLQKCSDGFSAVSKDGVIHIYTTKDRKVEFIVYNDHIMAYVKSAMGYPAYYPVYETKIEKPVKAVLMDLDGTSIKSEDFWIWIIEKTTASLLDNPKFTFEEADIPFVSGHSVSEHLKHCIHKYCPDKTVEEARTCDLRVMRRWPQRHINSLFHCGYDFRLKS